MALLIFLAASSSVNSQEIPVPPPPDTAISWDVHRSLGVVLVFETDKGKLYFAHPVIMSYAVPGCKSIVIQPEGETINITDVDTTSVPMRHIVLRDPIAFRYEGDDWQSPYKSTFHE